MMDDATVERVHKLLGQRSPGKEVIKTGKLGKADKRLVLRWQKADGNTKVLTLVAQGRHTPLDVGKELDAAEKLAVSLAKAAGS
jgi:hypothetical protein